MAVARNRRWDRVPLWVIALEGDDETPITGLVRATLTGVVQRVDGRVLYPAGATVEAMLGDREPLPEVRALVRSTWRAADLATDRAAAAAAGETFDEVAWDAAWGARWDVLMAGAAFFAFPAVDDPDTVQTGWQVKIEERFTGGRTYFVEPRLADLDRVPPGVNLSAFTVPPGNPTSPAPVYAKGLPGGVASLDQDGLVPRGQLPAGLGSTDGASGPGSTEGLVTDDDLADALAALRPQDVGAQPAGDYATEADVAAALAADLADVIREGDARLSDARTPTSHTHPAAQVTGLPEAVQDVVGAMVKGGSNVVAAYDDAAGTLTLSATASGGGTVDADGETIRDTIAAALRAGPGVQVTVDDPGDTIQVRVAGLTIADVADLQTTLATKVDDDDPRLSDARVPLAHGHAIVDVTGLQAALEARQTAAQVDARVQQVVGAAPAALDTLEEIAAALAADDDAAAALTATVADKADRDDPRFTDARTPVAHRHDIEDVDELRGELDDRPIEADVDRALATKTSVVEYAAAGVARPDVLRVVWVWTGTGTPVDPTAARYPDEIVTPA